MHPESKSNSESQKLDSIIKAALLAEGEADKGRTLTALNLYEEVQLAAETFEFTTIANEFRRDRGIVLFNDGAKEQAFDLLKQWFSSYSGSYANRGMRDLYGLVCLIRLADDFLDVKLFGAVVTQLSNLNNFLTIDEQQTAYQHFYDSLLKIPLATQDLSGQIRSHASLFGCLNEITDASALIHPNVHILRRIAEIYIKQGSYQLAQQVLNIDHSELTWQDLVLNKRLLIQIQQLQANKEKLYDYLNRLEDESDGTDLLLQALIGLAWVEFKPSINTATDELSRVQKIIKEDIATGLRRLVFPDRLELIRTKGVDAILYSERMAEQLLKLRKDDLEFEHLVLLEDALAYHTFFIDHHDRFNYSARKIYEHHNLAKAIALVLPDSERDTDFILDYKLCCYNLFIGDYQAAKDWIQQETRNLSQYIPARRLWRQFYINCAYAQDCLTTRDAELAVYKMKEAGQIMQRIPGLFGIAEFFLQQELFCKALMYNQQYAAATQAIVKTIDESKKRFDTEPLVYVQYLNQVRRLLRDFGHYEHADFLTRELKRVHRIN